MAITPGYIAAGNGQTPAVPLIGSLTVVSSTAIRANWNAPAYGKHTPQTYSVSVYKEDGTLIASNAATVSGTVLTADITGLSPITNYKVKVKLVTPIGSSEDSEFSNVMTTNPPPPPPVSPPISPPGGGGGTTDCSVCVYGTTYYTQPDASCASGERNYSECVTEVGCDNIVIAGSCTGSTTVPTCANTCGAWSPYSPPCGPCVTSSTRTRSGCGAGLGCTTSQSKSCSCTPSTSYSPWGTCRNKQQWRNVSYVNSNCSCGSYSQVRSC